MAEKTGAGGKPQEFNKRNGRYEERDGYSAEVNERIRWAKDSGLELPLNSDGSVDDFTLHKAYESRNSISLRQNKDQEDFFGEEFKGYIGKDAIDKLLQEKRGHIKGAFERPEIGGIDIVWGNKKGGLLHAILKRDRLFESGKGTIRGLEMVKKNPEIIEKGKFEQDGDGRFNIDYDGYRVGIMPTYFDKKIKWIVTAMEIWK